MQQLEGEIKRLEAEYNMFFAGRLPRLPCETRDGGAHKTGEPAIPYHRFAEAVRAQVAKLGGGESDVVFRVELKEGKATLAVKSANG
jgi:hypothetical protein